MWSKGAAQPAQHVAHNGLGRPVSRPLLLPPLLLIEKLFSFFLQQHCQPTTGKRTSSDFRDSLLMLVTKVGTALISNAHQKNRRQNQKEGKEGSEGSKC